MKLCRYGRNGFEKPGVIDAQGQLRDLSGVISNIDQETISSKGLTKLRKIRPESLPLVRGNPRFGVPYTGDRKSTRLNSSHLVISYAVFCLKKKKKRSDRHYT